MRARFESTELFTTSVFKRPFKLRFRRQKASNLICSTDFSTFTRRSNNRNNLTIKIPSLYDANDGKMPKLEEHHKPKLKSGLLFSNYTLNCIYRLTRKQFETKEDHVAEMSTPIYSNSLEKLFWVGCKWHDSQSYKCNFCRISNGQ